MRKERYEEPNLSVHIFKHEDVVTLSNGGIGSGDEIEF